MSQKKKLILGPLPEQQDDYSHYEETVTRWDRIIAVIIVFIVMLVGGVYLLMQLGDEKAVEAVPIADQMSSIKPGQKPSEVSQKTASDQAALEQPTVLAVPQSEALPASPVVTKQTADDAPGHVNAPKESKLGLTAELEAEPIEPESISKSESDENIPESKPKALAESSQAASMARLSIHQDAIARAVLTLDIKDDEPGKPLPFDVPMSQEGIIKVILFTEMQNLKGEILYHEWFRNGVRQARVKIPVNVRQQKSYSSKFINAQMLGDWQVKVSNERLGILVDASFRVIAAE